MIDAVRLATDSELPTAGLPSGERGEKKRREDVFKNMADLRQQGRALIKRLLPFCAQVNYTSTIYHFSQ